MSERDQSVRLYLLENITKFEENYRNAVISLDEFAIHDYRVALKKLRTLNLFMKKSGLDNQYLSISLKSFKKIFRRGGVIRDLQVFKNLISEYEIKFSVGYSEFLSFLNIQISVYREKFIKSSGKALTRLDGEEWENLKETELDYKDIQIHTASLGFIQEKMSEVNDILLKKGLNDYQLHLTRKILKQIRFVYEMRMAEEWNSPEHQLHLELLKKLETILGIWHDKVTFLNTLSTFLEESEDDKVKLKYNDLEKKIRLEIQEGLKPLKPEFAKEFKWFKNL